jgi:hypothetical protein
MLKRVISCAFVLCFILTAQSRVPKELLGCWLADQAPATTLIFRAREVSTVTIKNEMRSERHAIYGLTFQGDVASFRHEVGQGESPMVWNYLCVYEESTTRLFCRVHSEGGERPGVFHKSSCSM